MSDDSVHIARTADLAAVCRLGVACGLEDSGRDEEQIEAAWGAFDGESLVGAIVLERNQGLETVNWMAVDDAYRRRGIAGRLYAALEREALDRGITRLWVTARTPAFFVSQGYDAAVEGAERDILLGECPRCSQFGRGCTPQALMKRIDHGGPSGAPQSEGATWRDRD
ncbi:MAG: GNAT family N-acetyltransferase [Actinobacteria bacterium]|nr:GNAT family N-acetyltransferase [Actinomycetota bacterium]